MLRRATLGYVLLVILHAGDALAQSSTLRDVARLRRPALRAVPARADAGEVSLRPSPVRALAPDWHERTSGKAVIVIRCANGLSHPPLLVVDGVALGLMANSTIDDSLAGRLLSNVRPEDIVSVEVAKGEVALERYGPRAHNGVVLVTTTRKQQSAPAAVPHWSVEAVAGYGRHTQSRRCRLLQQ